MKIQHGPHWANIYLLSPFLIAKTKTKKGPCMDKYIEKKKKKSQGLILESQS